MYDPAEAQCVPSLGIALALKLQLIESNGLFCGNAEEIDGARGGIHQGLQSGFARLLHRFGSRAPFCSALACGVRRHWATIPAASFKPTTEDTLMINKQFLEDLTQQLTRLLPQAEAAGEEARKAMAAVLQKAFASLDLLTRDEFEAQSAALARAEERLAQLEQEVARLEALMKEQGKA